MIMLIYTIYQHISEYPLKKITTTTICSELLNKIRKGGDTRLPRSMSSLKSLGFLSNMVCA